MTAPDLPVGPLAPKIDAVPPAGASLHGKYTSVVKLAPGHAPALYKSLGGQENAWRWTYMLHGGFNTLEEYQEFTTDLAGSTDPYAYAILSAPEAETSANPEPVGVFSFLNISAPQRRIEIGSVNLGDRLKRTRMATEAFYLFIKHAFEDLHYHRVEWKANALNAPSVSSAKRLGFVYEGIFRKHMIVQGRLRDTAWFSITDDEWPVVKQAFDTWLEESNFDAEGQQKRTLQAIRDEIQKSA